MMRAWSQGRKGYSPWTTTDRARLRILVVALGLILVRTWGTYVADDILLGSQLPSLLLTFYLLAVAAALFSALHRPWTLTQTFVPATYWRIALNGGVLAIATFLWVFGIRHCRALRAMLLECADLPLMLFFILNTRNNHSNHQPRALDPDQQRLRGSVITLLGVGLSCLSLLTSCTIDTTSSSIIHHHSKRRICPGLVSSVLGTAALFTSTLLAFSRLKKSQALAAEVGGLRTLNCLSLIAAVLWTLPAGLCLLFLGRSSIRPPRASLPILINSTLCAISTVMIHLYMEPFLVAKANQIPHLKVSRLLFACVCSAALSFLRGDMQVGVLVLLAFALLEAGLHLRTSRSPASSSSSSSSSSFLAVGSAIEHRLSHPAALLGHPFAQELREVLAHALSRPDSRRLVLFLGLSSAFMLVEAFVGLLSNSLGLMGDAGHMLFDNAALAIGIWAACMADRPPDHRYPYGYNRFEVLAGFVNAIFLVFVAITILVEATERFASPPTVGSPHLLPTSIAGFLINLGGLVIFGHLAHNQQHQQSSSSGSGKADNHAHHNHGPADCCADLLGPVALARHRPHAHAAPGAASPLACLHIFRNANMQGIFLHLFADMLGSLSVIISSVLIHCYRLHIADPICSLVVALLILWSTGPLITHSVTILLQRLPAELQSALHQCIDRIRQLPGVQDVAQVNCWQVPVVVVLSVTVMVNEQGVDRQVLLQAVRQVVFEHLNHETTDLTVQIEQVGSRRTASSGGPMDHHDALVE